MHSRRWEIELGSGSVLVALGLALLLTLPPPWWPNMGHYWLELGLCAGGAFLLVGLCLVVVALSRAAGADWPPRFVLWWDSVWTRKRAYVAIVSLLIAIFLGPLLFDARSAETPKKVPTAGITQTGNGNGASQGQNSGQTGGTINNNGTTYNAPVTINPPTAIVPTPKPPNRPKKHVSEASTKPPSITNSGGIVTLNQTGGQNTVNNFSPPKRALTNEAGLADDLRPYGQQNVGVVCAIGDAEACQLAEQFVDAMKHAGWLSGLAQGAFVAVPKGIIIGIGPAAGRAAGGDVSAASLPRAAVALIASFRKENIPFVITIEPSITDPNDAQLIVGVRD